MSDEKPDPFDADLNLAEICFNAARGPFFASIRQDSTITAEIQSSNEFRTVAIRMLECTSRACVGYSKDDRVDQAIAKLELAKTRMLVKDYASSVGLNTIATCDLLEKKANCACYEWLDGYEKELKGFANTKASELFERLRLQPKPSGPGLGGRD